VIKVFIALVMAIANLLFQRAERAKSNVGRRAVIDRIQSSSLKPQVKITFLELVDKGEVVLKNFSEFLPKIVSIISSFGKILQILEVFL
jgi:hypothetical protein